MQLPLWSHMQVLCELHHQRPANPTLLQPMYFYAFTETMGGMVSTVSY